MSEQQEPFIRDHPVMDTSAFAAKSETRARLERLLLNHAGLEKKMDGIPDDAVLRDTLKLDSLDLVEVAMRTEEEFGIEIPDEVVDDTGVETFGGLLRCVEEKLAAKA